MYCTQLDLHSRLCALQSCTWYQPYIIGLLVSRTQTWSRERLPGWPPAPIITSLPLVCVQVCLLLLLYFVVPGEGGHSSTLYVMQWCSLQLWNHLHQCIPWVWMYQHRTGPPAGCCSSPGSWTSQQQWLPSHQPITGHNGRQLHLILVWGYRIIVFVSF